MEMVLSKKGKKSRNEEATAVGYVRGQEGEGGKQK